MRDSRFAIFLGVAATGFLFFLQSCGSIAGPPVSVQLGPDSTGAKVMVVWTPPAEGVSDAYRVYFAPLAETALQLVTETTASFFVHEPHDTTGTYVVAAVFGEEEYRSPIPLTTMPVYTDTITVLELDAAGNSGYGWNRISGAGGTCSMLQVSGADIADFYLTDFAIGSNRLPYATASPFKGPDDQAGLVPPSNEWRRNGITDVLTNEQEPLPVWDSLHYFTHTDITPVPAAIGVATEDGYFGLLRVTNVDPAAAEVRVVSWFQLVPGLRLLMHEAQ